MRKMLRSQERKCARNWNKEEWSKKAAGGAGCRSEEEGGAEEPYGARSRNCAAAATLLPGRTEERRGITGEIGGRGGVARSWGLSARPARAKPSREDRSREIAAVHLTFWARFPSLPLLPLSPPPFRKQNSLSRREEREREREGEQLQPRRPWRRRREP